ncbi:hypothetical protein PRIPAC_76942 [Pristionchus pacificus]|uniref:Fatty-acid and retinol-binding protein 1 n=1 Tax=Pristionchus pacificus TaxID=54126 RepID=A0A2A6CNH3_PRIPA|nr:hypothetical protein PRIPAC_76942 [Pristionchus pacificus]|eukprot:PDM79679.1 hypothetical protein PRIPAC_32258 [Pristionchus pacificus]
MLLPCGVAVGGTLWMVEYFQIWRNEFAERFIMVVIRKCLNMRTVLCLLLFLCLAAAAPSRELSDPDAAEGGLIGMTDEETADFMNDMTEAKKIGAEIKFESKEDVFKVLEEKFPKSYAIISKPLVMASKSSSNPTENTLKEVTQMAKQFKKMRSLLCLLPLICFSLAAPVDLSDHQKLILKIFGPDTDLIRAKLILEEEGAKFGLSGNEYFDGCTGSIMFESGRLTAEEEADVKKDIAEAKKIIGTITFASKEDVFKVWEERFPKSYAIFSKRLDLVKTANAKLDAESQKCPSTLNSFLLSFAHWIVGACSPTQRTEYGLITSYTALPQSSKDALEKTFCSRASIRIAGAKQQFASLIRTTMRVLLLLSLVTLATGAPFNLTEVIKKIQKIWGKKNILDIAIVENILHEEGKRIGITAEDYLESCYAETEKLLFTDEDWATLKEDGEVANKLKGTIKVESKEDIFKLTEKHLPKSHAILMKRYNIIKEFVKGMDADSQKFVNETIDALLGIVVTMTNLPYTELESRVEKLTFVAKDFVKIFDAYAALPQSSKNALERAFCARVTLRIVDFGGQLEEFIETMYRLAKAESVTVTGDPFQLSEHQKIQKIWGLDSELRLAIAEQILHEEGQKIGITAKEYLESCYAETEKLAFTDEERADLEKDGEEANMKMGKITIEKKEDVRLIILGVYDCSKSTDVFKVSEKQFPKSHAIIMKRLDIIKGVVKGMDSDSQKFVHQTTDALLEMIVAITKPSFTELNTPMEQYTYVAKDFAKIFDAYSALPQSSKNTLERAFCARVSLRIVDNEGQFKEFVKLMYRLAEGGPAFE